MYFVFNLYHVIYYKMLPLIGIVKSLARFASLCRAGVEIVGDEWEWERGWSGPWNVELGVLTSARKAQSWCMSAGANSAAASSHTHGRNTHAQHTHARARIRTHAHARTRTPNVHTQARAKAQVTNQTPGVWAGLGWLGWVGCFGLVGLGWAGSGWVGGGRKRVHCTALSLAKWERKRSATGNPPHCPTYRKAHRPLEAARPG
jgi:hypothetical protein